MREFYQQVFGLPPVLEDGTDIWALFDVGGCRFALHAIPTQFGSNIDISSPPVARESSPVKLIFLVDNVPEERTRLEALGVVILQREWQKTAEECDAVDPEGNLFQISSVRV